MNSGAEVWASSGICAKDRTLNVAIGAAEAANAASQGQQTPSGKIISFGSQCAAVVQDEILRVQGKRRQVVCTGNRRWIRALHLAAADPIADRGYPTDWHGRVIGGVSGGECAGWQNLALNY